MIFTDKIFGGFNFIILAFHRLTFFKSIGMFAFEIRCIPSALFILRVRGLLWRVSCALCAVLYYLPIVSHSLTQEQLATILFGSETEMSPKLLKHLLNTLYLRITDVKILSPF